ncbi:hypothetical protein BO86DRAFT_396905 [Aspergillus japonicus CBS 114.51]|uniref:Secreted protein n=1 Tax=Aspergillus japonicus CBS 114.51 TaxID=1448312 RepID=A0A8T8X9V5_ASPJA|nr:hypothetical protein BO86DRAFT_396905 [Aspergillus japonicus CBS 114.51]RAH84654.1 hypothetical protein BO86DRAFT_396905 [Aspergillus japonicus CBS 114.51]
MQPCYVLLFLCTLATGALAISGNPGRRVGKRQVTLFLVPHSMYCLIGINIVDNNIFIRTPDRTHNESKATANRGE